MTSSSTSPRKIRAAIVGLGFGAEFIPIHQRHPHTQLVATCQRSQDKLDAVGKAHGVERRYRDYAELLKDKEIDAVHIKSPIPDHAAISIAALQAGKHVMCTVPMATSIDDCRRIVELAEKTGLKYMMAETVVYAREFLFIKQLADAGELGMIQFVQASHQQDMDGWPNYWPGLPPMDLAFTGFEVAAIVLATLITRELIEDGTATWFEDVLLLGVYLILAIGVYHLPE